MRFVDRRGRKLARQIFHGMIVHGAKLQHKQASLNRLVDIANELFAMLASVSRAAEMRRDKVTAAREAAAMADLFCRISRERTDELFYDLWDNDEALGDKGGVAVGGDGPGYGGRGGGGAGTAPQDGHESLRGAAR